LIELWTSHEPAETPTAPHGSCLATHLTSALSHATDAGVFDSFVLAYRLDDRLLSFLAHDAAHYDFITEALRRAQDDPAAAAIGLKLPRSAPLRAPVDRLTQREAKVYELLADGKSNREIAEALVITEATAKVHVRHILKKLGVRTRIEAAILAAMTPRREE
jgi:DNA-binding NarL/FixJ family response regulator